MHRTGARANPTETLNVSPESPPREGPAATRPTDDQRRHLLARVVAFQIAQGARVESQSDFQAVLARGLRLHNNHGLTITGGEKHSVVVVDEYGNVAVRKL
jgi:hypothetical protein